MDLLSPLHTMNHLDYFQAPFLRTVISFAVNLDCVILLQQIIVFGYMVWRSQETNEIRSSDRMKSLIRTRTRALHSCWQVRWDCSSPEALIQDFKSKWTDLTLLPFSLSASTYTLKHSAWTGDIFPDWFILSFCVDLAVEVIVSTSVLSHLRIPKEMFRY